MLFPKVFCLCTTYRQLSRVDWTCSYRVILVYYLSDYSCYFSTIACCSLLFHVLQMTKTAVLGCSSVRESIYEAKRRHGRSERCGVLLFPVLSCSLLLCHMIFVSSDHWKSHKVGLSYLRGLQLRTMRISGLSVMYNAQYKVPCHL